MSRRSFSRGFVPLMVLVALVSVSFAPPTRAEDTITTQPYADLLNPGALKGPGVSGKGITIVLTDGPVDTSAPELQGAGIITVIPCPYTPTSDSISHGAAMASLLVSLDYEIAPGATVINYVIPFRGKDLTQEDWRCATGFIRMMILALSDGTDIISYSMGGNSSGAIVPTLTKADLNGAIVAAAVDNDDQEDYVEFHASSNLAVDVAATDTHGNRAGYSNYGKGITAALYGGLVSTCGHPSGRIHHETKGTSVATTLTSGCLALAMEKWPEAANRQTLQSLVRTAVHGDGIEWGPGYSYGLASLHGLFAEDPISLSDENPLLYKNDEWVPNEEYYNDYIDGLLGPADHWI